MTGRFAPAALPITEDDAFIEAALERASVPTLLMSLVLISGDESLLEGDVRPQPTLLGDMQGGLTPEQKAAVRARALAVLTAYRDAGCRLPAPPSPETIRRMMSFMVGQEIPDDYAPMMLEEMALDGEDARWIDWDGSVPAETRRDCHVLVIGAGMSGLLAAIRLREAGISYTMVEKNDSVGGTWYENSYPGCRVDVSNHFYSYSFEPNHRWSQFYSQRDELQAYFERCADEYEIRDEIRFRTEVVSACFDEAGCRWQAILRGEDGEEEVLGFDAIISAVGQLNRPKVPAIEGLDSFRGKAFHSARWDHGCDLAGKRVAVIGTGASALQLVPEVAKEVEHLTVFQRSPAWMFPNPDYHRQVSEEMKWLLEHVPYYARWYRFLICWQSADALLPSLRIDPDWPHPERSVNALNEATRVAFTSYIESQIGDDPELLAKVVPTYPPFGKRILQDNGSWLAALKRDDVALVTEPIERVVSDGVLTADGAHHSVDVIVFATGFHANRFLWPMEIAGRGGRKLAEQWGDDPQAYLGITVPGFPNLFCLYGPGTNLAHAGSIIFHSECQVRYVMECLRVLLRDGHRAMDCREEVQAEFNARLQAELETLVWSHPGMNSWYKNESGRVTTTSPWRLADYWHWTRRPDVGDYDWLD